MDVDNALENLNRLLIKYKEIPDFSESDTRCKIIDIILKECLGWTEEDIVREPHVDSGFIDYKLNINGITHVVLEAKKTGSYFDIPKSMNARNYKIKGCIKGITSLHNAIKQARSYCIDIGSKYAIISNGYQFVIFSAFLPGRSWEEATCVVFNSLKDIKEHFNLFWNIFSRSSVSLGSLIEYLDKQRSNLSFNKVIDCIYNNDQKWSRNKLYQQLRPIADFVFSELIDAAKTDILKECYVFERSNRNLGDELDTLLIDRLPHYTANYKIKDIFEREARAGVFERQYYDFQKTDIDLPLVVLLGGVGSGKSTFLHRFFKVVLKNKESLLWFYLDFRASSFDVNQIDDFIYSQILNQFQLKYFNEIKDILEKVGFNPSIGDKRDHIKKLFTLLKYLKFSIAIVIDNVDQHDFKFQENLFIFSNHLCKEIKVITILSLREETFFLSTRNGVFDAFHVPVFHISSPNFLNMILPRIKFSIDLLMNEEFTKRQRIDQSTKDDLIRFFEILKRSLSKDNEQSRRIVSFFENVSVGNMREALQMFSNFLISGNTNIEEMFVKEKDEDGDTFQIAFHQLLKSIMLGEFRFYSSDRSKTANIFDFDTSISDSHFNQLRILNYLSEKRNAKSLVGRGYISIDDIIIKAEDVTLPRNVVIDSLSRLSQFSLVLYDNQSRTDLVTASFVKITPAGDLYLNDLIHQFGYLDNVLFDTPVADTDLVSQIRHSLNEYSLPNRVNRTKLFIQYLLKSEQSEFANRPQLLQSEFGNKLFAKDLCISFNKFILFLFNKNLIPDSSRFIIPL